MVISKLEGDAVFAYVDESKITRGDTLIEFMESMYVAFRDRQISMPCLSFTLLASAVLSLRLRSLSLLRFVSFKCFGFQASLIRRGRRCSTWCLPKSMITSTCLSAALPSRRARLSQAAFSSLASNRSRLGAFILWVSSPPPLAPSSSIKRVVKAAIMSAICLVVNREPRIASLIASGDVRALCIDQKSFEGLIRERPDVSLVVIKVLGKRLKEATEGR
jgi:hypothetical protein